LSWCQEVVGSSRKNGVQFWRDNTLVEIRKKFKIAEQERDELKLKLENFQTSLKNLMFDCDELLSSESDVSVPMSPVHDRYKSGEGYHAVPPPYKETFMPPRPDLVFHDVFTVNETVPPMFNVEPSTTKPTRTCLSQIGHLPLSLKIGSLNQKMNLRKMVQKPVKNHAMRGNHQYYARMTRPHTNRHVVPIAILTRSRLVPLNAARPVTTAVSQTNVTTPRAAKHIVNKTHSPIRRHINHKPSPKYSNFHQKFTIVKAKQVNDVQGAKRIWGNPHHALKDEGVIDSGCSRHMTGNISLTLKKSIEDMLHLVGIQKVERSQAKMCDKNNSVLFIDTECIVLSSDFKLHDDNQVLLRVPRENNMYNVDLKNIVPSGDLTCLFAKATLDESNLWHRRLGHINFKTMNKLVK
nr:ribonuclease H-like domain-containing protein [Tanacetum cinerariifolium]